jgi:hypothetical protein
MGRWKVTFSCRSRLIVLTQDVFSSVVSGEKSEEVLFEGELTRRRIITIDFH